MDLTLLVVILLVGVALTFDYINGFHDAANSIATVVATRVLTPRQAVVWAAFFNFLAAFAFGIQVASTVGRGMIEHLGRQPVGHLQRPDGCHHLGPDHAGTSRSRRAPRTRWLAALQARRLPRRASVPLIMSGWTTTLIFIVLSPLIGFGLALLLSIITLWMFRGFSPHRVDTWFRRLQLLSAAAYSLGHGSNDAQKTMGIIAGVLFTAGYLSSFSIPFWVIMAAHAAIALGTLTGGWRIVHTMGSKITTLAAVRRVCRRDGRSDHAVHGQQHGDSGQHDTYDHRRHRRRRRHPAHVGGPLGVARRVVWAWVLTIPAAAMTAAVIYKVIAIWAP